MAAETEAPAARQTPRSSRAGFLRWAALAIGLIAALLWGFALARRFFPLRGSRSLEDIAWVLIVAAVIGLFYAAYLDGGRFGPALIVAGVAFSVFAAFNADSWHLLAAALSGVPFVAAGLLMFVAWHLDGGAHQ